MKLLATKIFAGYLIIIILFTSMIIYFSFQTARTHYTDTFKQDLTNLNETMVHALIPYLKENKPDKLRAFVKNLGNQLKVRITVIDTDGVVLADSKANPDTMDNHRTRPEVAEALSDTLRSSLRFSKTLHNEMLYHAVPIKIDHKIVGVSRVAIFLSDINKLTDRLSYEILQVAFIIIIISLIGVLIFSRNITKPLTQLSTASRKVALGDFDVKVETKGSDEISELSKNFNNMTTKLKEYFGIVSSQKQEYLTLISAIKEGLVVLDTEGRIILSNHSFRELCNVAELNGRYFWEFIPESEFGEIFSKVMESKSSFSKEVSIGDKHFIASANFVDPKSEVVMLLHDITEIKKLEQIKRDFVVNVSHELKTPLTAIKGFIETLEEDIDKKFLNYIEIIKRNTNRLINIVQDLLLLSELEEKNNRLMFSKVDIRLICDHLFKIFDHKLEQKNLKLTLDIEEDFPKIKLDPYRIEQVFVNLIDNAIKYSDEGEIKVKIYHKDDTAYIIVSDTGVGIPKEHHARIFERFYIVDKSRSRKFGGTGLGLSIVKHIVLLHNGEIHIESGDGIGTKFIIQLPLKQKKKKIDKSNN